MALENLLPPDATELFRYQVLLDHLKLDKARLVADAYLNSPTPYSDTMAALTDKFGQPQRLTSLPEFCPTSVCPTGDAADPWAYRSSGAPVWVARGTALKQTPLGPAIRIP